MKKIKKLLTIGLAFLLMLCMSISLVGCKKIDHNAVIITEGITYQNGLKIIIFTRHTARTAKKIMTRIRLKVEPIF